MMRGLVYLFPVLLAACAPPPTPENSIRDRSVPMSITTRGSVEQMSGEWVVRAAFPAGVSIRSVAINPRADGLIDVAIRQTDCAEDCHMLSGVWRAKRISQNRLKLLTDSSEDTELWVLWMDESIRTAVVAAIKDQSAFILDRSARGGTDRIEAGRAVLEFNGYDTTQLVMFEGN